MLSVLGPQVVFLTSIKPSLNARANLEESFSVLEQDFALRYRIHYVFYHAIDLVVVYPTSYQH